MVVGIIVACLPTLRPVFFPRRKNGATLYVTNESNGYSRKAAPVYTISVDDYEMDTPLNNNPGASKTYISARLEEPEWKG
jgi:hypothetical protein